MQDPQSPKLASRENALLSQPTCHASLFKIAEARAGRCIYICIDVNPQGKEKINKSNCETEISILQKNLKGTTANVRNSVRNHNATLECSCAHLVRSLTLRLLPNENNYHTRPVLSGRALFLLPLLDDAPESPPPRSEAPALEPPLASSKLRRDC